MKIKKNVSLKKYTTFQIGGPAKFFVDVKNKKDLMSACEWAEKNKEKVFILSGGSNILVADSGFDGLVIKISNKTFKTVNDEFLACGAGLALKDCIKKAWQKGFQGMEDLYGVYGSVGGAVRGNAGAFEHEMADFVDHIEVFDLEKKEFLILEKEKLDFDYRTSLIKNNKNIIIFNIYLKLEEANGQEIKKAKKKAFDLLIKRTNIHDPRPSAGSVFKNITDKKFDLFLEKNPKMDMPETFRKKKFVAVGWLTENSDLKGFQIRGAKLSEKHGNFVVNFDGAKAEDVIELISVIKTKVRNKFGVELQEEIQYVGFK
jgi:UDP-N-acetylmuramate dehydrogenase